MEERDRCEREEATECEAAKEGETSANRHAVFGAHRLAPSDVEFGIEQATKMGARNLVASLPRDAAALPAPASKLGSARERALAIGGREPGSGRRQQNRSAEFAMDEDLNAEQASRRASTIYGCSS